MSFPQATVAFSGAGNVLGADFSLHGGVTPSVCQLFMVPQDNFNPPPGTLTFQHGPANFSFQDCAVNHAYIRRRVVDNRWVWSVSLYDRRWRWAFGSISGEYNRRLPNGTVDEATKKTPSELLALCFDRLSESNPDLSRVPTGVYPYVNWKGNSPALAMARILEQIACTVTLGTDNRFHVWPLGQGQDTPTGAGNIHPKYRYVPRSIPAQLIVQMGPSRWQSTLALEAVGRQADNVQKRIDELDYKPDDWESESPWTFPNVTDDNRTPALDTVWREYRVSGQEEGGFSVPNVPFPIEKLEQYLPLSDVLLDTETDVDDVKRPLRSYVEGEYWPYRDVPENIEDHRYTGSFELHGERGVVKFPFPVVGLASDGTVEAPTLKLICTHGLKTTDGQPIGMFRSLNLGGPGGTRVLRHPELFSSYIIGGANTENEATTEADRYLQLHAQQYQSAFASELTYGGIFEGELDGNIRQARWKVGVNRPATTQVSVHDELDVTAPSERERRDRETLKYLAEVFG